MKRHAPFAASTVAVLVVAFGFVMVAAQSQQPPPQSTQTPVKPPAVEGQKPATVPDAQKPTEKADKPELEQPADFVAFNEAMKTADRVKRIEALQKFATDHPDSTLRANAESQAKTQALSLASEMLKKYQTSVDRSLASVEEENTFSTYSSLANELARADLLLDRAEEYATKALAAADEAKYIERVRGAQQKPPAPSKLPPNTTVRFSGGASGMTATLVPAPPSSANTPRRPLSDDDLRTQFRSMRASLQNTLGQIYVKRGKSAEAEKLFKAVYTDAHASASSKATAARGLADVARKAKNDAALLEYLTVIAVNGATPELRQELDDVYRRMHGGSLDGLERVLDERYLATFKPIQVEPHVRKRTARPRLVLAELLTGAACPPCVAADLAFDAVLERYSRSDVAVLAYHQHIPGPDPMTNPATQARGAKDGVYALQGVPTYAIDGKSTVGGGGADAAERLYKNISESIEKQLAVPAAADITLKATVAGTSIKVAVGVSKIGSRSERLRLQVALVEARQQYSGPNGIRFHPMVVRSLAGPDFKGFAVPAGKGLKVEHVFDVAQILADNKKATEEFLAKPFRGDEKPRFTEGTRDEIDLDQLMVVAFVQDEAEPNQLGANQAAIEGPARQAVRQVLQSAFVKVPPMGKKATN